MLRTHGDNLATIATPEMIEGNITTTLVSALTLSLSTFGVDKTLDIVTHAVRTAREATRE